MGGVKKFLKKKREIRRPLSRMLPVGAFLSGVIRTGGPERYPLLPQGTIQKVGRKSGRKLYHGLPTNGISDVVYLLKLYHVAQFLSRVE